MCFVRSGHAGQWIVRTEGSEVESIESDLRANPNLVPSFTQRRFEPDGAYPNDDSFQLQDAGYTTPATRVPTSMLPTHGLCIPAVVRLWWRLSIPVSI